MLVEEANKVRSVNARMVWTRYRSHTRLAQELSELATKELGLDALATTLGMRVAYPEALGDGLTVAELPEPSAKAEVKSLIDEIQKLLRKKL